MLQAKSISHSYKLSNKNTAEILSDINFTLPDKGVVFIVGKSGCGKTTLLNILEGILKPTSGQILFDNIDIYDNTDFKFNSKIGILFQNYNLIDGLTVYENLLIASDIKNTAKEFIDKKLKQYNLYDLKDHCVDDLSGGEKQRVSFIRSILHSPDILFCDEPTGAIDEENAKILMKDIRNHGENSLVIIVTHNKDLIENDDMVLEISNGKIDQKLPILENNPVKVHSFSKKQKQRRGYLNILIKRLFKKSSFKHVLFITSMLFSILFISLSLSLSYGLKNQENNLEFSYLNFNKFTISKRDKKVETDSPISLVKEVRPEKYDIIKELKGIEENRILNNYNYFLNGNNSIYSGINEIENVRISLSHNKYKEVVVNKLFYDLLKNKSDKISIELNQKYSYNYELDEANIHTYEEEFHYQKLFEVKKIINEFSYLNTPTIYIPYEEFELFMKESYLTNLLKTEKKQISWFEVVSKANNDDPITSFSYDIFLEDKNNIKGAYKFIDFSTNEDTLKIINEPHFYVNSFLDIANILVLGLNIFCGLSGVTTLCLLFFIITSLYMSEKKEIAVLKVLGSREKDIRSIFNKITFYETIFSILLATVLSLSIIKILNIILNKKLNIYNLFSTPNFGANLDYLILMLIIFFISISLTLLINYLAIFKATRSSIAKELREE